LYDQLRVATPADVRSANGQLMPFISSRYRSALQKLNDSYRAKRPAAILVSKGRWAPSGVVDSFRSGIDEDAVVARIDRSCADATSFMHEIIQSIGFDSSGMGLADLEKVLELFLQHQRQNKRRTIIAIQYSDKHSWWVLDTVRRLVEAEAEMKYGLMIILAGPPDVISALNDPILDVINHQAGERIVLTPLKLCDTRDFVRERVAAMSASNGTPIDVGQVFEFDAVSLIHEICGGVPDDVDRLCSKCFELLAGNEGRLVTVEVVKDAASLAQLSAELPETAVDLPILDVEPETAGSGKLLVDSVGEELAELELMESSVLIGRDQLCGVCISAAGISRFHGMLVRSDQKLHFVDLNSTNGSHVNGHKVDRCSLHDGDIITIGSTRITYVSGEEREPAYKAAGADFDELSCLDQSLESPVTRLSRDLQLIKTS